MITVILKIIMISIMNTMYITETEMKMYSTDIASK